MAKEIILLGATGSIGMQTVEVCKNYHIRINAIAFDNNIVNAEKIINQFNIKYISVNNFNSFELLKEKYPQIKMGWGKDSINECFKYDGDCVNAITGIAGLMPTYNAIKNKKNVLLANKETMVVAGKIIMQLAKDNNVRIIPIDSEHNALYRLINADKNINKLIITASGGAFRDLSREELVDIDNNNNIQKALNHPNWQMGKKVTIDCASMVNKGLEVIEAHHLFGFPYENIETIIHPESIIHSMVEYADNSVGAIMYNPSMIIPIQHALLGDYYQTEIKKLDFNNLSKLTFRKMDFERYPMIKLAYTCGKMGGLYPTVYNASNEIAVKLFLEGKISFLEIEEIINKAVNEFHNDVKNITIEEILKTDEMIKNKFTR